MIKLDRQDTTFILTLDDEENRWNTTFVRAISDALDEVEASTGPAALVTTASHPKFFSNISIAISYANCNIISRTKRELLNIKNL